MENVSRSEKDGKGEEREEGREGGREERREGEGEIKSRVRYYLTFLLQ
jgi:hypothetical protein